MNSVGDSFGWAFRDPQWAGKMLLQGLIAIIPIVGWIAMTGWLMMAFENARSGRNELPPAGFHLERGIAIFVVFLVYGLVLNIPAIILYGIGGATAGASNGSNAAAVAGSSLFSLAGLLGFAGSLFFRFLIPSLIVNTYHGGFAGGFDLEKVWKLATLNVTNSVIAGLIIFVASLIGGVGFLCCIGFIFTVPYENTINAGAAAWFDRQQAAPAMPPAAPAT
jgi:uncharacterized protein DUF4013